MKKLIKLGIASSVTISVIALSVTTVSAFDNTATALDYEFTQQTSDQTNLSIEGGETLTMPADGSYRYSVDTIYGLSFNPSIHGNGTQYYYFEAKGEVFDTGDFDVTFIDSRINNGTSGLSTINNGLYNADIATKASSDRAFVNEAPRTEDAVPTNMATGTVKVPAGTTLSDEGYQLNIFEVKLNSDATVSATETDGKITSEYGEDNQVSLHIDGYTKGTWSLPFGDPVSNPNDSSFIIDGKNVTSVTQSGITEEEVPEGEVYKTELTLTNTGKVDLYLKGVSLTETGGLTEGITLNGESNESLITNPILIPAGSTVKVEAQTKIIGKEGENSDVTFNLEYESALNDLINSSSTTNLTISKVLEPNDDLISPEINGETAKTIIQGSEIDITDPSTFNLTATDETDGDLSSMIILTDDDNFNINVPGEYTLIYSVSDASDNTSTFTVLLTIEEEIEEDIISPVISGETAKTIIQGSEIDITDPSTFNLTATDETDGDLSSMIILTDDDNFDTDVPGEYTLIYSVSDASDNTSTFTVLLTIEEKIEEDIISPVISGETAKTIIQGSEIDITDPSTFNLTATDETDGDLSSMIVLTNDDNFNIDVPGEHTLIYSVSDASGNTSTFTVLLTIEEKIEEDIISPVISGPTVQIITEGTIFDYTSMIETGLTATDETDGDITSLIKVDSNISNFKGDGTDKPGEYIVVYTVSDEAGNSVNYTVMITVQEKIIEDKTVPVINGETAKTLVQGSEIDITDPSIFNLTATDETDGDLSSMIVLIDDDDFDINVAGEYTLIYSVSDAAGNTSTFTVLLTIEEKIEEDIISPVISGETAKTIIQGSEIDITDPSTFNLTATDETDGDLSAMIVLTNDDNFNIDVPREYTLIYSVSDVSGNTSTFIVLLTIEEKIEEDIISPVISGPTIQIITEGTVFNFKDLTSVELTAIDETDGNVTSSIVLNSNVDNFKGDGTDKPGEYVIVYEVSDVSGNVTNYSVTIIVQEDSAEDIISPKITGDSEKAIELGSEIDINDPGTLNLKAVDETDGDLSSKIILSDDGGFDVNTAGQYILVYSVSDTTGNIGEFNVTLIVEERTEEPTEEPTTEDNKTEDNKTEDNKTEDNKTEDNKTEDNKTEDNKTEDNETEDNKTEDNKTEDNKTEDSNKKLSELEEKANKETNILKSGYTIFYAEIIALITITLTYLKKKLNKK